MTSTQLLGILSTPPPCFHSGQIHSTKSTQPPLLHQHLGNPSLCRPNLSLSMAPKTIFHAASPRDAETIQVKLMAADEPPTNTKKHYTSNIL